MESTVLVRVYISCQITLDHFKNITKTSAGSQVLAKLFVTSGNRNEGKVVIEH